MRKSRRRLYRDAIYVRVLDVEAELLHVPARTNFLGRSGTVQSFRRISCPEL